MLMVVISLLSKNTTNLPFSFLSVISKLLTMDLGHYIAVIIINSGNNKNSDNNVTIIMTIKTDGNVLLLYINVASSLLPKGSAGTAAVTRRAAEAGKLEQKALKPLPTGETPIP